MHKKPLLLMVLWLMLGGVSQTLYGQQLGGFLTHVNTYAYTNGPENGGRYLLASGNGFAVVDSTSAPDGTLWYQVIHPSRTQILNESGWITYTPAEITAKKKDETLPVFSEIVKSSDNPVEARQIPAKDIRLKTETEPSGVFSGVVWRRVAYSTKVSRLVWVKGTAGVYRPGRQPSILFIALKEMAEKKLDSTLRTRLLNGVVKPGDSPREVRWALGDPSGVQGTKEGETQLIVWQYPDIEIQFENNILKSAK
ncbi:MAG: hypothetical protein OEW12_01760 [Deltaproteobacteria bacterium]|nr:hypothetical protein [Deltaproteobacteria bacterium]